MKNSKFRDLFGNKKIIIGMIHLAGDSREEKIKRALHELEIYSVEGLDGVIIEDYHGSPENVKCLLEKSLNSSKILRGVNVLRDPYSSFD